MSSFALCSVLAANVRRAIFILNLGMLSGAAIMLYSLVMLIQSLSYGYMKDGIPSAGFFPFWINGILFIVSIIYILESIFKDAVRVKDVFTDKSSMKKILSLVGGLAFFCLTANFLGFLTSGIVLLFSMFIWDFKWPKALGFSALFMLVVYGLFQYVLKVSLPTNMFGF